MAQVNGSMSRLNLSWCLPATSPCLSGAARLAPHLRPLEHSRRSSVSPSPSPSIPSSRPLHLSTPVSSYPPLPLTFPSMLQQARPASWFRPRIAVVWGPSSLPQDVIVVGFGVP
ncbi:hypothetical protein J3458_003304 [Metarhizium acridum]|uniref:uncharacterized protein n=1 Tax=Metarhizium acridum TaxID=92637 RepID=UPI001C6B38E7|nr:hypothetical protein J3458_003304 [Metarhizium acridum]